MSQLPVSKLKHTFRVVLTLFFVVGRVRCKLLLNIMLYIMRIRYCAPPLKLTSFSLRAFTRLLWSCFEAALKLLIQTRLEQPPSKFLWQTGRHCEWQPLFSLIFRIVSNHPWSNKYWFFILSRGICTVSDWCRKYTVISWCFNQRLFILYFPTLCCF